MERLISSILTRVKELPSISSKRVNTPPHAGVLPGGADAGRSYFTRLNLGVNPNRTPRLRHSRYVAATFSVTSTTCVARPISLYSAEPFFGWINKSTVEPSGGDTATQRCPAW